MVINGISNHKKGFVNNHTYFDVVRRLYQSEKPFFAYSDIQDIISFDVWKDNLKRILKGQKSLKFGKATIKTEPIISELTPETKRQLKLNHKIHYYVFDKDVFSKTVYELFGYYLPVYAHNVILSVRKMHKKTRKNIKQYKQKERIETKYHHLPRGTEASSTKEKLWVNIQKWIGKLHKMTRHSNYSFVDEKVKEEIIKQAKKKEDFEILIQYLDICESEVEIGRPNSQLIFNALLVTINEEIDWNKFGHMTELFNEIIRRWADEYKYLAEGISREKNLDSNKYLRRPRRKLISLFIKKPNIQIKYNDKLPITYKLEGKQPFIFKQCKLIRDLKEGEKNDTNPNI